MSWVSGRVLPTILVLTLIGCGTADTLRDMATTTQLNSPTIATTPTPSNLATGIGSPTADVRHNGGLSTVPSVPAPPSLRDQSCINSVDEIQLTLSRLPSEIESIARQPVPAQIPGYAAWHYVAFGEPYSDLAWAAFNIISLPEAAAAGRMPSDIPNGDWVPPDGTAASWIAHVLTTQSSGMDATAFRIVAGGHDGDLSWFHVMKDGASGYGWGYQDSPYMCLVTGSSDAMLVEFLDALAATSVTS